MRLLLDTHIFLAMIEEQTAKLPAFIRSLLSEPGNGFHLSVASVWEIAIKHRLGKLELDVALEHLPDVIRSLGIGLVPITEIHALAGVDPAPATRDPFDRILLAQCRMEGLRLVTIDRALASHPMAAR